MASTTKKFHNWIELAQDIYSNIDDKDTLKSILNICKEGYDFIESIVQSVRNENVSVSNEKISDTLTYCESELKKAIKKNDFDNIFYFLSALGWLYAFDLEKILRSMGKVHEKKNIKESSDIAEKISSEIDKSYWIDKLIDDLDRHYESMEKAWLKNLDKLSDEDILGIIDDCMGKSKTLVGKSEMLKNKMIDDLSKAYDDYIDDIDRQIRIGKSEDEIKNMIETTLENDIKMYLKLAYNNKASSNYFMVKFAEDNLI